MSAATELWPVEQHLEGAFLEAESGAFGSGRRGEPAPEGWKAWLRSLFPSYVTHDFAHRHAEFWEWVWSIGEDDTPVPFVAVWPRGGGKTTSAELACTALGVRGKRRYAWYVNETQDKADKNVENVAAHLESAAVERHYPSHAERKVGKYGQSRGWRRSRLRTSGGYTVDALGLDTASRGLKVEEQRPDLIILDDLDGKHDSPATTAKKIATLTTSILPAGASSAAVLAIQNLIIPDGIFTRLSDGRADFLVDRIISGPHPAVMGLETEWQVAGDDVKRAVIVEGRPTWAGQDLSVCQRMMDRMGRQAFLKECQQMVKELAEGRVLEFRMAEHSQAWSDDEIRAKIEAGDLRSFGGIDFGLWRFAFVFCASDRAGRVHVLDEHFSQREKLETRAQAVHETLEGYGVSPEGLRIYGDSANQTDIVEINQAFRRGWSDGAERTKSDYRVVPVEMRNKARVTSVERLNDMLGRRALLVRKGVGRDMHWKLGHNASSEGEPMRGSRLLWEINHWSYPDPTEGKAQKQDPDDHTADGADAIAALRYAVMSWLRSASYTPPKKTKPRDYDDGLEKLLDRIEKRQNGHRSRRGGF